MKVETFVCNMLRENCYVAYDESSREAAIIDPGLYWDEEAQTLDAFVRDHALTVKYMLCTHLHFDHIFGTTHVEDTYGVGISASDADSPWIAGFVQASARFGHAPWRTLKESKRGMKRGWARHQPSTWPIPIAESSTMA